MSINPVNIILLLPVIIILVSSFFTPFTMDRIEKGVYRIFNNIEFIVALVVALYLTKGIFFDRNNAFFQYVYDILPATIKSSLAVNNVYTYLCAAFIILLLVVLLFRLITYPIYSRWLDIWARGIYRAMGQLSRLTKRVISVICSIPGALVALICISFILYFMNYYFTIPGFSKWTNDSIVLNRVYDTALKPVINADIVKKLPVIINDKFRNSETGNSTINPELADNIRDTLDKYNIKVIQYFNGVTLDEAIATTPEIDSFARELVEDEIDDYKKAKIIYKWIASNIDYDYQKAKEIVNKASELESGSIICYQTRKGICFDYSSLYVTMCRAVGVNVRLITGMGYSGLTWGDHSWNQIYSSKDQRWVNVDCTFGVTMNNFDNVNFNLDHKDAEIQGEWVVNKSTNTNALN